MKTLVIFSTDFDLMFLSVDKDLRQYHNVFAGTGDPLEDDMIKEFYNDEGTLLVEQLEGPVDLKDFDVAIFCGIC